jgi:hypothetical protein
MKKLFIFGWLIAAVLASCNSNDKTKTPASENDLDAARNFIRAALDGRWDDARNFLLQDSVNIQLLETTQGSYRTKSSEEKRSYHESNINLYETRKIGDSITIVNYSNSFMNKKDSLKIVLVGGQWLIDLKYSLLARDSTQNAH